jgi:hypothetical protein
VGLVGFRTDFEGGEGFALFLQNADYIGGGAAAEGDEDEFHGAAGGFFRGTAVHDDGVAASGDAYESFFIYPNCIGGNHYKVS